MIALDTKTCYTAHNKILQKDAAGQLAQQSENQYNEKHAIGHEQSFMDKLS